MSLNVNDPALRLLYGLDESGPNSLRQNAADSNLSSSPDAYALESMENNDNGEGSRVVSDGRGGNAIDLSNNPGDPWVNQRRWNQSPQIAISQMLLDGAILDAGDWATDGQGQVFGGRFYWEEGRTGSGGGIDSHHVFALGQHNVSLSPIFSFEIIPDTNIGPASGGDPRVRLGVTREDIWALWPDSTTGSPPSTGSILIDRWYSWAAKQYFSQADGARRLKFFLYDESTGTQYTWDALISQDELSAAQLAWSDAVWAIGAWQSEGDSRGTEGPVDQFWYYASALADSEITEILVDGINIPWSDEIFTVLDHDVRVASANENSSFPVPRQLPIGGMTPRHVVGVQAQRHRLFYEGFRAGRPYSIRRIDVKHDTMGPWNRGRRGNVNTYNDFSPGLIRQPGQLPPGAIVSGYDADLSGAGLRRRRGYKIRRSNGSANNSVNSFYSWRTSGNELFWLYKIGGALFRDNGSVITALSSTGWNTNRHIIAAALDNRLIVIQNGTGVVWDGTTSTHEFGEEKPTGGSVATTAGTHIGTFVYGYTFYDPNTGDETEVTIIGSILLASEGALLSSLDTGPTNARFTQQRIYRSAADGSAPLLGRVGTQDNAATFTDNALVDGTDLVGAVRDSDGSLVNYLTGSPPDSFDGCFVHQGRMFYWAGKKLYWSEPNNPLYWDPRAFITMSGPIVGAVPQDYRIVVFTRNVTEIVESDFARDPDGNYAIRQNVVDEQVGIIGPLAHTARDEEIWWLDSRGVFSMTGDKPIKRSDSIDNLFRYLNTGRGETFSCGYNHLRDQIWFSVAMAGFQVDNTRLETILAVSPAGRDARFNLYRTNISHVVQFDDDLNGIRFGGMDQLGNLKEYESYEGEGQEGDESGVWEEDDGIASVSGNIVTVKTTHDDWASWATDEHRGKGVILRDVSTGTKYYLVIQSNTASTFTVDGIPDTALSADDGYYIGGMMGDVEFSEQDYGTPNVKVVRDMKTEFDDLTLGRFV